MPGEPSSELKFEIGHVLFIDIVGYSKLLINEQSEQLETLKKIVRGTEQCRLAEAEGKLLRLPTGDGGALVFRTNPEAPVLCAVEISRALKNHPELRVRMGIHSGPVNPITDLNEQANIAGAGINIAQRVMDCGDAGHILLSKRVADDLEQYPQWRPYLHELGECELKHGVCIGVVNFYGDEIGNPEVPKQLKVLRRHRARTRWTAIATALLLLIGAATAFVIVSKKSAQSISAITEKSIAVLPFENLSRDPDNAYFAEGVRDELLARLSKAADLKVISIRSTEQLKSSQDDLSQIARKFGVANILAGSVQRSSEQVRVNVQLVRGENNAHLWADTFDRKLTDVFAVETEIARAVADTLQAKLTGSEQQAIAARPTENTEAYQLYLKGRFFWNKRTGQNLNKAADHFNQAIAADSNYALAYVGLADAYVLMPFYGAGTPQDCYPKAKAAAKKALELDDTLSEAHTSLAYVLQTYDLDFDGSTREFQRAIELNPNYATAHHWYDIELLVPLGRFDEAIREAKRGLELDPLSLPINGALGRTYYFTRRYDEAIEQLRKTSEMDPGFYYVHWNLGSALAAKGAIDAAIEEYQKARTLNDDPFVLGLLARAYGFSGNKAEAMKILDELAALSKQRYVSAYSFALVYLGLGDKEETLRWLEKSYQDRAGNDLAYIKVEPLLDSLRGDPRFEGLVAKVFAPKNASSP
jgi:TolB-like protein/Flp pilus assembly protein TadD